MKKAIRLLTCTAVVLSLFLLGLPAYAASVRFTLPTFPITINGQVIDNTNRQYPLILHNDITYFPMTYDDCRFLGLESDYSAETGLAIQAAGVVGNYNHYAASSKNPLTGTAQTVSFAIHVNGDVIDNSKEEYPLLLYRNITYFPLTWRFADAFGWEYYWDAGSGLVISSYSYEELQALFNSQYGDQIAEIVYEAANKLQKSDWQTLTFRTYSRHANRMTGILSEHLPSGTKWYKEVTMTEADDYDNSANPYVTGHYLLSDDVLHYSTDGMHWQISNSTDFVFPEIPDFANLMHPLHDSVSSGVRWGYYWGYFAGDPCLILSYMDESPTSLPIRTDEGGIIGGSIYSHRFYLDLHERRLRSYWTYATPISMDDNDEMVYVAPSTTWYSVIDFDYQAVTMPRP